MWRAWLTVLFCAMAKDERTIEGTSFLEGKLLIALPGMSDPRFAKSVIFMCAHSADGAMGIVINRPIEGLGFREMARKLDLDVTAITPDFPVLSGGPRRQDAGRQVPDWQGSARQVAGRRPLLIN